MAEKAVTRTAEVYEEAVDLKLLRAERNEIYTIKVSSVDAERARNDLYFAQLLLSKAIRESVKETTANDKNNDTDQCGTSNQKFEESQLDTSSNAFINCTLSKAYTKVEKRQDIDKKRLESRIRRYNLSTNKCSTKFNTLKRRYRKVKAHNVQSGNDPMTFDHYDQMDEIFRSDPTVKPLALCGNDLKDEDFENMDEWSTCSSNSDDVIKASRNQKRTKNYFLEELVKEKKRKRQETEKYQQKKLALLTDIINTLKDFHN